MFHVEESTLAQNLCDRFGITIPAIKLAQRIVKKIDYQLLDKRLTKLKKIKYKEIDYLGDLFATPEGQLSLLICCLDDASAALKVLPRDNASKWSEIALYTDCLNVFKLFKGNKDYVWWALDQDSVNIFCYFIDNDCTDYEAERILERGSFNAVKYLIDNKPLSRGARFFEELLGNYNIPLEYTFNLYKQVYSHLLPSMISTRGIERLFYRKQRNNETAIAKEFIQLLLDNKIILDGNAGWYVVSVLVGESDTEFATHLLSTGQIHENLPSCMLMTFFNKPTTLPVLKLLFDPAHPWALPRNAESLRYFINPNNWQTFLFLMNPENGYSFTIDNKIFESAARAESPLFLEYLLAHCVTPECLPTSKALSSAINAGQLENAKTLLAYVTPTQENLADAVKQQQLEFLQVMMESNPSELSFTEEMLKKLMESPSSNPSTLDLIRYMLSPNLGLTITQEFFDNLYNKSCCPKSAEIILLLLDNYDLTLTQEKFESLILEAKIWGVLKLHAQYPKRFAHLSPTQRMLDNAVYDNDVASIMYLLQPQFRLEVRASYLSSKFGRRSPENANNLLQSLTESPTEDTIVSLVKKGCIGLANDLVKRYQIRLTEASLTYFKTKHPERLLSILKLAQEGGLIPANNIVISPWYLSDFSSECYEHLVDPQYNVRLRFGSNNIGFDNLPAIVQSNHFINNALHYVGDIDEIAKSSFDKAMAISPRQCIRVATYALKHPDQYRLTERRCQALLHMVQEATKSLDKFSIIERKAIGKYLDDITPRESAKQVFRF